MLIIHEVPSEKLQAFLSTTLKRFLSTKVLIVDRQMVLIAGHLLTGAYFGGGRIDILLRERYFSCQKLRELKIT